MPESWGDAKSLKVAVKATSIWGFRRGASDKLTATCQFNARFLSPSAFARLCLPWCRREPCTRGACSVLRGSSWDVAAPAASPLQALQQVTRRHSRR